LSIFGISFPNPYNSEFARKKWRKNGKVCFLILSATSDIVPKGKGKDDDEKEYPYSGEEEELYTLDEDKRGRGKKVLSAHISSLQLREDAWEKSQIEIYDFEIEKRFEFSIIRPIFQIYL
jgi:hypothetical protein